MATVVSNALMYYGLGKKRGNLQFKEEPELMTETWSDGTRRTMGLICFLDNTLWRDMRAII